MQRVLQILAVALILVAAFYLWRGVTDWAFVCGVLGACAFFLSLRGGFKARSSEREAEKARLREEEASEE